MPNESDPKSPAVQPTQQETPTKPPEPKPIGPSNRLVKGTRVQPDTIRTEKE